MNSKASGADRHWAWPGATLLALGIALVWAPVPLGSNRAWATVVLALALAAVLAAAVIRQGEGLAEDSAFWVNGRPRATAAWGRWVLAVALGAHTALVAAQWYAGISEDGLALLQTMDAESTRRHLMLGLALWAAWLLLVLRVRHNHQARFILAALMAAGVLQVLASAVFQGLAGRMYWFYTLLNSDGRPSGTFANPDHLAGSLELALGAGFGLLIAQMSDTVRRGEATQHWRHALLRFALSPKMLVRLMLVAMVMGLVITRSRMGNAAFLVALLWVSALVAWRSAQLRKPALWLLASMLVIDIVVIGQWVGLDKVVDRLQETAYSTRVQAQGKDADGQWNLDTHRPLREQSVQERLEIPRLSLRLIEERPWFGAGGGTYHLALPAIKPAGFPLLWDHAHNDYVEIAVETGLVGLALVLLVGVASYGRALLLLADRQGATAQGVGVAALTGLTAIGAHAMVDFNLHIPANALAVTVLCALVWCVPRNRLATDEQRQRSRRRSRSGKDQKLAGPALRPQAVAALLLPTALWMGWPLMAADWKTQAGRQLIDDCPAQGARWAPAQWVKLEAEMRAGLAWLPESAQLHTMLGSLYACQGTVNWADDQARTEAFAKATASFNQSLQLRPTHGPTWAAMATGLYLTGQSPQDVAYAWESALLAGPHELPIQQAMFDLVLLAWDTASPQMKAWLEQLVRGADEPTRKAMLNQAKRLGRQTVVQAWME